MVTQYTNTKQSASDEIWIEMVDLCIYQFGHLGPDEIIDAFRLGAAGKILGVTSENFRAWYGCFTVSALGSLLKAYDEHRKSAIRSIERVKDEQARIAFENRMMLFWQSQEGRGLYEKNVTDRIARLKTYRGLSFTPFDVRIWPKDYEMLCKRELITLSNLPVSRRWDLVAFAQKLLLEHLKGESLKSNGRDARLIVNIIESGGISDDFEKESKRIAERLAVIEFIEGRI